MTANSLNSYRCTINRKDTTNCFFPVSGFLNTSLSTIEKVFGLSSTESGIIISTYDVASLLAVIPVTYFGQSGSKPRYLGGGALLIALGCFVFFLPEAFRDAYDWVTEEESLQYCSNSPKVSKKMLTKSIIFCDFSLN